MRGNLRFSALGVQKTGQSFQFDGANDVAARNGAARHAIDDAGSKILSDGEAADFLDGSRAFGAIVAHAGHQDGDGLWPAFLGDGAKEDVCGRTMAIDARRIRDHSDETVRRVSREQVAIAGANESASGEELIAGVSLMNFDQRAFIEPFGEHFGEASRHMLRDQQAAGEIRRHLREQIFEGVWPAGRDSDGDNASGRLMGFDFCNVSLQTSGRNFGDHFGNAGEGGGFDFERELLSDFLEFAGSGMSRFGDEIESAERKGF